jgi:hypothetical protein
MPIKKMKNFICFEMLEENYKFEKLFFFAFSNKKTKVTSMYKISCLHPNFMDD